MRAAALAGERAGYARGAQDIRVLASRRAGGMPLPLDDADDARPTSANLYVAVRVAGYWADIHGEAGESTALGRAAAAGLAAALPHLHPGISAQDLAGRSDACSLAMTGLGTGPAEAPDLAAGAALQPGDVCSVVATARAGERVGIASAVVAVAADGVQPLGANGDAR
jgi:hypothetical protein